MDAAIAALSGAAIGTVGTLVTNWFQQRQQTRRELQKAAVDLGLKDFERAHARAEKAGKGTTPPLSLFVAYHMEVLLALSRGGFGPDDVRRIDAEQKSTYQAIVNRNGPSVGE
jgi:hypothetical protein